MVFNLLILPKLQINLFFFNYSITGFGSNDYLTLLLTLYILFLLPN